MPKNVACTMKGFMTKAEMTKAEMAPMTFVKRKPILVKGSLKKKKKK